VYRGSYGNSMSIPIRELVVGDIVDVKQGDRVPADCLLLEEMNITVDESLYFSKRGEEDHHRAAKEPSEFYGHGIKDSFGLLREDNHKQHPDPVLFSDSKVMTGWGKALVCCVGENTLLAKTRKPKDLEIEEQKTFLEQRLEVAADQISKFAKLAAILVVITRVLFIVISSFASDSGKGLFSHTTLTKLGETLIVAVVLLIVAVPEGLPLAVSIAMALSIKNLKDDEILIKNIDAVQSCAMFNDLCVGKTGTLTNAKLSVRKF